MSLQVRLAARVARSFPRVSGDEPKLSRDLYELEKFSPRERG